MGACSFLVLKMFKMACPISEHCMFSISARVGAGYENYDHAGANLMQSIAKTRHVLLGQFEKGQPYTSFYSRILVYPVVRASQIVILALGIPFWH